MKRVLSIITTYLIPLVIVAVFVDSLRFKFTDHPNTQVIFGKLDTWAGTLGVSGLFSVQGLFSQYVIGSFELLASLLLVLGFIPRYRTFGVIGAAIAFMIMTGAVFFHLFTPLGIDPNNDGGGLFVMAVVLWVSSIVMLALRRNELLTLFKKHV